MMPDVSHDELRAKWMQDRMQDPAFKTEYERIEHEEMPMFDVILAVRKAAGQTQSQAQVAERMGTKDPAVARLENVPITGTSSPSLKTLKKYAAALGKRLEVCFT